MHFQCWSLRHQSKKYGHVPSTRHHLVSCVQLSAFTSGIKQCIFRWYLFVSFRCTYYGHILSVRSRSLHPQFTWATICRRLQGVSTSTGLWFQDKICAHPVVVLLPPTSVGLLALWLWFWCSGCMFLVWWYLWKSRRSPVRWLSSNSPLSSLSLPYFQKKSFG